MTKYEILFAFIFLWFNSLRIQIQDDNLENKPTSHLSQHVKVYFTENRTVIDLFFCRFLRIRNFDLHAIEIDEVQQNWSYTMITLLVLCFEGKVHLGNFHKYRRMATVQTANHRKQQWNSTTYYIAVNFWIMGWQPWTDAQICRWTLLQSLYNCFT